MKAMRIKATHERNKRKHTINIYFSRTVQCLWQNNSLCIPEVCFIDSLLLSLCFFSVLSHREVQTYVRPFVSTSVSSLPAMVDSTVNTWLGWWYPTVPLHTTWSAFLQEAQSFLPAISGTKFPPPKIFKQWLNP